MRKKVVAIIITALCLTACGSTQTVSNDVNDTVSDVTVTTESVVNISESAETEEKSDEESAENEKDLLSDKYVDIYDCLENGDYDKAIELIEAMKPEPSVEMIPLTLDNWSTYFSTENVITHMERDANGNIMSSKYEVDLVLKPEYKEKLVSISGEIGYECDYVPHIVTNIDKATGLFDIESVEKGPEGFDSFLRTHISQTMDIRYIMDMGRIFIESSFTVRENMQTTDVIIANAEEIGDQYLYCPEEITIVRIDGEIVLEK